MPIMPLESWDGSEDKRATLSSAGTRQPNKISIEKRLRTRTPDLIDFEYWVSFIVSLLPSFVLDNEFADLLPLPIMKIVCPIETSLSIENALVLAEHLFEEFPPVE